MTPIRVAKCPGCGRQIAAFDEDTLAHEDPECAWYAELWNGDKGIELAVPVDVSDQSAPNN